jgi:SAM-dependent methyltransferase
MASTHMPGANRPSEFDAFASDYDAGMGDPIKRLAGGTADTFLEQRAAWLLRNLSPTGRLLDFGCGTGAFLRALRRADAPLELVGCDVAAGMLAEATRRWDVGPVPELRAVPPGPLPFADAAFDVVTAVSVFHHIVPAERDAVARELLRVVRPHGAVVIFEHNPANPVTRWLVQRAAIDANAVLLWPRHCARLLRRAGAATCHTSYLLFFPPRFRALWRVERLLGWLPLGGAYVTVGRRAR